jgi:[methyl-Co(III) methanol-specific corrinoid protein]:coenzyme M methyltransferase
MAVPEMTSKERFFSLLRGGPADKPGDMSADMSADNSADRLADRPAVINPVSAATAESVAALGLDFVEAHTDAESAAALACHPYETLGFDSIMPYFSVVAEAAALGADVRWGGNRTMPSLRGAIYGEPEQIRIPQNFFDRPTIRCVIDAIRIASSRHGRDALIIGKAMGPWTLCLHLYGMENTLIDTIDDRRKLTDMLGAAADITKMFASAQLEAGAHMVTVADHCTRNLVGPAVYEDFVYPLHKELNALFPGRLILHCCGNTEDRAGMFARAGFPLFHFESANDIETILSLAGDMRLTGCVNNPSVLLQGGRGDVMAAAAEILRAGVRILSPECAVPLGTPNANLRAIAECARRFI